MNSSMPGLKQQQYEQPPRGNLKGFESVHVLSLPRLTVPVQ